MGVRISSHQNQQYRPTHHPLPPTLVSPLADSDSLPFPARREPGGSMAPNDGSERDSEEASAGEQTTSEEEEEEELPFAPDPRICRAEKGQEQQRSARLHERRKPRPLFDGLHGNASYLSQPRHCWEQHIGFPAACSIVVISCSTLDRRRVWNRALKTLNFPGVRI